MSVFRIRLMHLKADIWWDMRTAQYMEFKKLNQYIIRLSEEVYDKEEAEMYAQWIQAYKRLIKAAYYFDMKEDHQAFKESFRLAEREYKDLRPAYERMDVDEWNEEEEEMPTEDDPFDKAEVSTMVFSVLFGVDGHDETLEISSENPLVKGRWLMERVQKLAWSRFGIKALNIELSVNMTVVNADDFLLVVLPDTRQAFRARCLGIDYQPYTEQYRQACKILQREVDDSFLETLKGQASGKLSLAGLALDSNDIQIVIHLLKRAPALSELDLSANLLRDADVLSIFAHVPLPARLWLHSNRLTSQCLDHLFMCELGQLQELGLAYNPLGPDTPRRMISMLATSPQLKHIAFDGGMISGSDQASLSELREKAAQAHVSLICNELPAM
ncbi:hypothetical protein BCR43DRAFT_217808 [Syncephalastrum racemosum]|uniref:Uncharacterized protein n=1 Tax=Syncephalastrum racemosum TaxID=13706 RepID=A0A1X2HJA1_SYNRA|nr:hypothetical protein BCR43DRAFT_217808 [Syncephalastrum racemosum]